MDLPALNIPVPKLQETDSYESAGDFVKRIALQIQDWLYSQTLSGAALGKRWVLTATLCNGTTVKVHSLGADGHSMIRFSGELPDGTPCLLLSHQHSVQLLAFHVDEKPEDPPKREIGFHTGRDEIKIPQ